MKKSAVVIGAGPCGLVATKELLEAGHDVVCLEQSHVIGGVFSTLRESSYDDLFLTVSNVFMAYSDFPCEESYVKYSRKEEYAQSPSRASSRSGSTPNPPAPRPTSTPTRTSCVDLGSFSRPRHSRASPDHGAVVFVALARAPALFVHDERHDERCRGTCA